MNKFMPLAAIAVLGISLGAGCSKAVETGGPVQGPVTDSGDTGLKPDPAVAVSDLGDAKHGAEVFSANCQSCHGAGGAGGGIGPVLKGEKARKDNTAAIAWIKNPVAPMPKLYPSPLGERDVKDVAAYVESL